MKYDLSILIPARNEEWLNQTVKDLVQNIEGNTEIIVLLDGAWPPIPLEQHERLSVIFYNKSIGQRAGTNQACKLSQAKYVMKVDAHCAFDKGFDVKMLEAFKEAGDNVTMVPVMRNLHVFDWVCPDGHRNYQSGKSTCDTCKKECVKEMVWNPKTNPQSTSYCFDSEPHFQYFNEYKHRIKQEDLTETMSLQGSCFMLTRERYWALNICDEKMGSWGSQGIEVACKTWLSGGRVLCNHKTWYAHFFRVNGIGFPYYHSKKDSDRAKELAKNIFFKGKFEGAIKPLSWLIDKFYPIKGWTDEDVKKLKEMESKPLTKGIVYYTDNKLDEKILKKCQEQILKSELPIVSVSLHPLDFGTNITLPLERGYLTMFKQILAGLEASTADIIFFCEHDVLYHPSHFDFTPSDKKYYYNTNVWKVRTTDGHAMRVDDCRQLSGLCAYRDTLITHYKERIRRVEAEGFSRKMGFEPGTHNRKERVDDIKSEKWESEYPNIDIRHSQNLTSSRWSPEEFRDQRYTIGWREAKEVEGWDIKSLIK